ncbi:hypothetical protein [Pseudalkalibacillus decolorationis]|uniref:hypothetical protein n=1 Tax=Pseudalkalibacillus decolorationis TaxID=163879 RepID=UPI002147B936|nr:hypothetical protein [Pseudalkalibacillus decolorationis]
MKKKLMMILCVTLVIGFFAGCDNKEQKEKTDKSSHVHTSDFTFDVNPETFELFIK